MEPWHFNIELNNIWLFSMRYCIQLTILILYFLNPVAKTGFLKNTAVESELNRTYSSGLVCENFRRHEKGRC
jgi:hypothetical protein